MITNFKADEAFKMLLFTKPLQMCKLEVLTCSTKEIGIANARKHRKILYIHFKLVSYLKRKETNH